MSRRRSTVRRAPVRLALLACIACGACNYRGVAVDASVASDGGRPDVVVPDLCVGVRPPDSAWTAEPSPIRFDADGGPLDAGIDAGADASPSDGGPDDLCPTCIGAEAPRWALTDFQPQSCGYGATYGLDVFRGHVTVVSFLAAW